MKDVKKENLIEGCFYWLHDTTDDYRWLVKHSTSIDKGFCILNHKNLKSGYFNIETSFGDNYNNYSCPTFDVASASDIEWYHRCKESNKYIDYEKNCITNNTEEYEIY